MSNLRQLLLDAGISQRTLVDRLKLHKSTVSLKLSGARGWDPFEVVLLWELLRESGALPPDLRALCVECSSRLDLTPST
jgi:transcriptional regulator with XRE-family HTH domain